MIDTEYRLRVQRVHEQLGIPASYAAETNLSLYAEPSDLVTTEVDYYEREQRLTPATYAAWRAMRSQALQERVELLMISAYRSVDYQAQLIRRKLDAGQKINDILCVNAAPGYSEHHTGRAIDIVSPECPELEEHFEQTNAFAWLQDNGRYFDFVLSFPRGNKSGICYEPWHWCHKD